MAKWLELLGREDRSPVLIGMHVAQGVSWKSVLQESLENSAPSCRRRAARGGAVIL